MKSYCGILNSEVVALHERILGGDCAARQAMTTLLLDKLPPLVWRVHEGIDVELVSDSVKDAVLHYLDGPERYQGGTVPERGKQRPKVGGRRAEVGSRGSENRRHLSAIGGQRSDRGGRATELRRGGDTERRAPTSGRAGRPLLWDLVSEARSKLSNSLRSRRRRAARESTVTEGVWAILAAAELTPDEHLMAVEDLNWRRSVLADLESDLGPEDWVMLESMAVRGGGGERLPNDINGAFISTWSGGRKHGYCGGSPIRTQTSPGSRRLRRPPLAA